jgi:predicted transcriptional regulator
MGGGGGLSSSAYTEKGEEDMDGLKTKILGMIYEYNQQGTEIYWKKVNAAFRHDAAKGTIQKAIQDLISEEVVVGVLTRNNGRIYEYLYTAEHFRMKETEGIRNAIDDKEFRETIVNMLLAFRRMK